MARPIRECLCKREKRESEACGAFTFPSAARQMRSKMPILYGEDARRFEEHMKMVESMSPEQRRANREKLERDYQKICKEWNLVFEY